MASEPQGNPAEGGPAPLPGISIPAIYLLDVEGTTSPLSLVYDQLFPYARKHLLPFLTSRSAQPDVQDDLKLLAQEMAAEGADGTPKHGNSLTSMAAAAEYLEWLMDRDRKSTALKSLQGKIWKSGYLAGELQGTVFPDVAAALARWSSQAKVAIYSSGSVEAQQLLFRYSSAGDLTPYLFAYFDTRTGPKTSPESYRAIAEALGVPPFRILFVSDLLRELDPARQAGCQTRLSLRPGNHRIEDPNGHRGIQSFAEIP